MKNPLAIIDTFLNGITMYLLTLTSLVALSILAFILSFSGVLFFSPLSLLASIAILWVSCRLANLFFSKLTKAPTNFESASITAFILFLIFPPALSIPQLGLLATAGVIAMASKYILAIRKKHIFNPAACAAVVMGMATSLDAAWWVVQPWMLPAIIVVGILITRKLRKVSMVTIFVSVAFISAGYWNLQYADNIRAFIWQFISTWSITFMAAVMFTEPLTTPPTKKLQWAYATLVGILFGTPVNIGAFSMTSEFALLCGNIFAYCVSSKQRLVLHLKEKKEIAKNIYEFIFTPNQRLVFEAGQYLEWTLPHTSPDSRGARRYFTVASSPTEPDIKLGIRVSETNGSSFKKKLLSITPAEAVSAGQLAGDFVLPKNPSEKLVFIAGGIGITPFRSMIQYLLDTRQSRDIILIYSNKSEPEIAYRELFHQATEALNIQIAYILSDTTLLPEQWPGRVGFLTPEMLREIAPDASERLYYLSGPRAMVESYKKMLHRMGIPTRRIKTDYFPGFT